MNIFISLPAHTTEGDDAPRLLICHMQDRDLYVAVLNEASVSTRNADYKCYRNTRVPVFLDLFTNDAYIEIYSSDCNFLYISTCTIGVWVLYCERFLMATNMATPTLSRDAYLLYVNTIILFLTILFLTIILFLS